MLNDDLLDRISALSPERRAALLTQLRGSSADTGRSLVGYVVGKTEVSLDSLRGHLAARLPSAAVPSMFVMLPELPMLPSGKVDYHALPAPDTTRADRSTAYVAPRTATEGRLASIFGTALGIDAIGINDDFWSSGGQSLLAAQIIARVRHEFGVDAAITDLFERPTVAGLAEHIDALSPAGADTVAGLPLLPTPRTGELPLSTAQQRHWFLQLLDPDGHAFNICDAIRITGPLDEDALRAALTEVVDANDILRTRYPDRRGTPSQEIAPRTEPVLTIVEQPGPVDEEVRAIAHQPFDLAELPVLRAKLLRCPDRSRVLIIAVHHIACDDHAFRVLYAQLAARYAAHLGGTANAPAAPALQYADYAVWERRLLGTELGPGLDYWRTRLSGAPQESTIPADRTAGAAPGTGTESDTVPAALTSTLTELARTRGTTLFVVVLSAFARVIGARGGHDEVVIGVPFANRIRPELHEMIGCFINPVAVRLDLSEADQLLGRAQRSVAEAQRYQHIPFERVVEALGGAGGQGRPPLFQVVVNFVDSTEDIGLPGVRATRFDVDGVVEAKYDMTLYVDRAPEGLRVRLVYDASRFTPGTARGVLTDLRAELTRLTNEGQGGTAMVDRPGPSRSLPKMRRKAVTVDPAELVGSEFLNADQLPLVLRPKAAVDLVGWVRANAGHLETELARYGAILFRGFEVSSVAEFEKFAMAFTDDLLNYVEGSSPRTMLADKVYTSTEYPPEYFISLHNELSYAHKWPGKLFFYCATAPEQGGETPIADGRKVLAALDPGLVERFELTGVRYLRNLCDQSGPGLSWRTVFETEDRAEVERYCREGGIEFAWLPDGGLRTSQVRPAVVRHPKTGERVWFNQADQWHSSSLDDEVSEAMTALTDESGLPINARHGDDTPIELADLEQIRAVFQRHLVRFAWERDDILLIDNTMVSHGRMPFAGPRRVLVSMGDTVRLDQVGTR